VCVCVCVRACVRACVRVCVYVPTGKRLVAVTFGNFRQFCEITKWKHTQF